MKFSIGTWHNASVWSLYRHRERIQMDPDYQREGGIWNLEKKKLLIDTIINAFDVPKLYLHKFSTPKLINDQSYDYAVIDGKQRLQTIWSFIKGDFALDSDFRYQGSDDVDLRALKYSDIASRYPDIKADFDAFPLHVITVEADDVEVIEDLFSRLNEAVPLNAPEKRNAKPGPIPALVRRLSKHEFFTKKIPFGNSRYRHYDIASKFLMISTLKRIPDLKKSYIDKFFDNYADKTEENLRSEVEAAEAILDILCNLFEDKDYLLKAVGMVTLYYIFFSELESKTVNFTADRQSFVQFENTRAENKSIAAEDIAQAKYVLMEFDRYAQSPNDAVALRFRISVLDEYFTAGGLGYAKDIVELHEEDRQGIGSLE